MELVTLLAFRAVEVTDVATSRTFLALFCVSRGVRAQALADQQLASRRAAALVWLQPACTWCVGMGPNTLLALLWAYGEYDCRCGAMLPAGRALGGVRALYAIGVRRRMAASWDRDTGIFPLITGYACDGSSALRRDVAAMARPPLCSPHWTLTNMCGDAGVKLRCGKYTSWWRGDEAVVRRLAYVVGQLAKEEWDGSAPGLSERQRAALSGVRAALPPDNLVDADFSLALARTQTWVRHLEAEHQQGAALCTWCSLLFGAALFCLVMGFCVRKVYLLNPHH
eukprot:TRINITY_DN17117_c0_g1_i1.p2 TRINITY_DN17117_c0_g1~~TRINITY_DN17117_c0_g1_i1.p2  ORF type:complete len:282 (+),score=73.21 TRINITY_DN17117_c0_g1_i1:75-920(+)